MRLTTAFFLALLLTQCHQQEKTNKLQRLLGNWQGNNSESDFYQDWVQVNDSTMNGKTYTLNGPDTLVTSQLQLHFNGDVAYCTPLLANDIAITAPRLPMITATDSLVVFENKAATFPSRIQYRFVKKDSLVIRVEGMLDGEHRFEEGYLHRIR